MRVRRAGFLWLAAVGLLICPDAYARRMKTIAFIPDPICRSSKLVTALEEVLETNLTVKDLVVQQKDKGKAHVLLRYFLIERRQDDKVTIQVDATVFENRSGKLLSEGTATSDPFSDDESGRKEAARQAGKLLAESLTPLLEEALWAKGKGRRVMLQVTLDAGVVPLKSGVEDRLKQALSGRSLRFKGSTERNLVVVFHTDERTKDLVDSLEKALEDMDDLKIDWVMQSDNTLMLRLARKAE